MSGDLINLLDNLDAKQLRERLVQLDKERSVIVVLLRAAVARDRKGSRAPAGKKEARAESA